MDIGTIITAVISLLGGNLLGVFLERRKRGAEAKVLEGDALSKMQENYAKFVEDSQTQYKKLSEDNKRLFEENKKLLESNEKLRRDVEALKTSLDALRKRKNVIIWKK